MVPLLALTATATPRVQHDVVQQLSLKHCVVFRSSFNRQNLRYVLSQQCQICYDITHSRRDFPAACVVLLAALKDCTLQV